MDGGGYSRVCRVIDAHAHFFSRRAIEAAAAQYRDQTGGDAHALAHRLGWDFPPADPVDLGRQWVEALDRHEIARIILFATVLGDEEDLARAVHAFPERLAGYALINPLDPRAADLARRAISQLGLAGLKLLPGDHGYHVYDERARAVYEVAQVHRVPVVLHFGLARSAVAQGLNRPVAVDLRFANPLDLQPAARDFPEVPFVVPHFGGGFLREALLLCAQCPNVWIDTSGANVWMNYTVRSTSLAHVLGRTVEVLGSGRVIFGTDSTFFPRGFRADIFEAQLAAMEAVGLSGRAVEQILGGNIEQLLARRVGAPAG